MPRKQTRGERAIRWIEAYCLVPGGLDRGQDVPHGAPPGGGMISLSDGHRIVMAAADLPPKKRVLYLQRLGAMLALRGRGHFNDSDIAEAAKLALHGLIQQPAV
ncbi:MAG TPA: hypothetical protein VM822_16000 [Pseudolabrys sp.]|jgi:hypothetical protein|nr:hypothetical protein [Pseudolabrys sp.]